MLIGNSTPLLFNWTLAWRERRLKQVQWLAAATIVALAAATYCTVCTLALGSNWMPTLAPAWGLLVALSFCIGASALVVWRRWMQRYPLCRWFGILMILTATIALLVSGEDLLALLYWQNPSAEFASDFASRAPLALVLLGFVYGPDWFSHPSTKESKSEPVDKTKLDRSPLFLEVESITGAARIDSQRISRIHSAGNYVELFSEDQSWLLRDTLKSVHARLAGRGFVRIHRCAIVNQNFIRSIRPCGNGERAIQMNDGTCLRISRSYRAAIDEFRPNSNR